jgi:hypothetical protein
MAEEQLSACTFRVVRYIPNLLRDEWINIGVVLHDRARNLALTRVLSEPEELARVRRLHPEADTQTLVSFSSTFESFLPANGDGLEAAIEKLDSTLSNILQFSSQKAVLTEDAESELERLYATHVTPPRAGPRDATSRADTRAGLRARVSEVFRRVGVWRRMERGVRVEKFTFAGDPLRLDFMYRQNGTVGFLHAVPLLRDAAQARSFAFTVERIKARLAGALFHAVTEDAPRAEPARFHALAGFLREQQIEVVPQAELAGFASRLSTMIQ